MPPILLKLALVAAMAAHGADLASTEHCLGAKTCHELNPWLARFDNPAAFGAAKMGVAAAGAYGTLELEKNHPKWAFWLNVGIAGAYTGIAAHNARNSR